MSDLRILTIIILAVAALLRSEIFFYLLYMLIGLQLVAWLWVRRTARTLRWTRELPAAAFPGETVDVRISVSNPSLLPVPWLALHESIPPALRTPPSVRAVVSLGAREQRVITYSVQAQRRGLYRLGPLSLRTGDVLGLREQALSGDRDDALLIYPRILPLPELGLPAALPFGDRPAAHSLFVDPARPIGVRDYSPADGMRQIDWKSSAHVGSLQVRRYEPAIAREIMLALTFSLAEYPGRFTYDAIERAVVAAASIAAALNSRGQPVGLCTSGIDALSGRPAASIPTDESRAHLIVLLSLLGRLDAPPEGDIITILNQVAAGLSWGCTIVLIGANASPELVARLLPLRRRGLAIALVLIEGSSADLALARRHGMIAYLINRAGVPVEAEKQRQGDRVTR